MTRKYLKKYIAPKMETTFIQHEFSIASGSNGDNSSLPNSQKFELNMEFKAESFEETLIWDEQ